MNRISHSQKETIRLGKKIGGLLSRGDIICLFGQLGAGKTVLVKGIAQSLGISPRAVTSPSFVLIREHYGKLPFYHFDLYRLKELKDILNLGYEEYLYGEGISAIEWAQRLKGCLPKEYLGIELSIKDNRKRLIKLRAVGERYKDLLKRIDGHIRD